MVLKQEDQVGRMRGRAVIALLIVLPLVLAVVGVAYVLNPLYSGGRAHAVNDADVPPKTTTRRSSRSFVPSPKPGQNERTAVTTKTWSYRPRRPRTSTSTLTSRTTTRRTWTSTKRSATSTRLYTPPSLHEDNVRLPKDLKPQHYDLEIEVPSDPYSRTFNGTVAITFKCLESSSQVVFHASSSMLLLDPRLGGVPAVVTRKGPFTTLHLSAPLNPPRVYELKMRFIGSFSDGYGFYKDSHVDKGTKTYATFFQPIGAREAFPSFDEPMYKATFNVTIVHPKTLTAISNMPLLSSKERTATLVADAFQRTPVMSTHLLAWYVTQNVNLTRGKVRSWVPKNEIGRSGGIVEMAAWALDRFEKFFNVAYPLPKLDIASVYKFEYPGMQHWGLILLSAENAYESTAKARTVVLHEVCHQKCFSLNINSRAEWVKDNTPSSLGTGRTQISYSYILRLRPANIPLRSIKRGQSAHLPKRQQPDKEKIDVFRADITADRWIGDLVTVNWWNELWVQEATAHHISSLVSQEYEASPRYAYQVLDGMFGPASGRGNRPISVPQSNSYSAEDQLQFSMRKRAHYLVRMMHFLLGDEDFRAGINYFLKEYSFKNAGEEEFLGALAQAQKIEPRVDLRRHMESWLKSDGYPEVTYRRNYENGTATVRQRCQGANRSDVFHVPLIYYGDDVQDLLKPAKPNVTWVTKREVPVKDVYDNTTAVVLNPASGAYYLLNYDTRNWALVCKRIADDPDKTDMITVVKLLQDVDYFYRKNETGVESVLWTWLLLQNQTDHALWAREQHRFGEMDAYLARFADAEAYDLRLLEIVDTVAKTLTYELPYIGPFGSDSLIWLLRLVCTVGHPMCVRPTLRLWKRGAQASHGISHLKNWLLEQGGIYYAEVVPCLAIRHQVPGALTTMYEWMQGRDTWAAMAAIACADNYTLLKEAVKEAIGKDAVSDANRMSPDVFRPRATFRKAFVDTFLELSPQDARYLNREYLGHFRRLADNLVDTEEQLKQVEEHAGKVLGLRSPDPSNNAGEPAWARLRRMRRDEAGLRRWLQGQLPPIGS